MSKAALTTMEVTYKKSFALITGGSKGIGFAIAAALAKRGYNLILIGRNMEDLTIAKSKLESIYAVQVEALSHDLSDPRSADDISKWCIEKKLTLSFLCNVAGIGGSQDYLAASLEKMRFMVRLNVESTMAITLQLLPLLKAGKPSYILNVSSLAGFAPIPVKNLYSATKSAIIFYSYALRYQLINEKISVSCLCPGPVFTRPDIIKDTLAKMGWFGSAMAVDVDRLAEIAIQKTLQRKMIIVPGKLARITAFFLRVLPNRILCYVYYKFGTK